MKSVKPGRGPSGMKFIGSVFAIEFGIFWTIMAARMGAPAFFPIFGVIFIIMGIVQAAYNYRNATGKNRYSSFDITDEGEGLTRLSSALAVPNTVMILRKRAALSPLPSAPTAARAWTAALSTAQVRQEAAQIAASTAYRDNI